MDGGDEQRPAHRSMTTGFFYGTPDEKDLLFEDRGDHPSFDFAGLVLDYDEDKQVATIQQRNKFSIGDSVEFFGPNIDRFPYKVEEMWDEKGSPILSAPHAMMTVKLKLDRPVKKLDMMRKQKG